ncbi:putative Zn-dependent peptidase [Naumannella cuiyingiana]|uniref:Putative Zn-dependent peptidase n=1 Tax=Naumannella cuiyingiana TaxID=1347891 RepID=A0A7Z0DBC3_9ACTN|nr:putative Zn-dependent peptidase [Naumannella cuiyingiana]
MTRNPTAAARRHRDGEIRRTVLPSGLRVITEAMPRAGSVALGFFVDAGSRHETARQHGASHFLEHVLFKGTPTRGAEQISAEIEGVGGEINAYTAKEHTCFHAKVLGADRELAVEVMIDMLANSLIRSEDLEAEREVILDEISMHADDPGESAHELVSAALFDRDPLGRPVIGSEESIIAMSRRQVINYWRKFYRPSSIVVSAAGRVDHDRLVAQLTSFATSSQVRPSATPDRRPTRPRAARPAVISRSRSFEQSSAVLGFGGVGRFDPRRPALNLLSVILGGGMSSRLFVEVRERRGLAYAIDAVQGAYSDAGMFTVEWASHAERAGDILAVVRDTIAAIVDSGVSAAELARAQGQVRGQTVLAYEGSTSRMSRNGAAELTGDARTVEDYLRSHDEVGLDDVTTVARELLAQPPVLGIVGPRTNRRRLDRIVQRWVS